MGTSDASAARKKMCGRPSQIYSGVFGPKSAQAEHPKTPPILGQVCNAGRDSSFVCDVPHSAACRPACTWNGRIFSFCCRSQSRPCSKSWCVGVSCLGSLSSPADLCVRGHAGRSWRASELRLKSFDDLHKLWFVLLKERNMLLTDRLYHKQANMAQPDPSRLRKVRHNINFNFLCMF